MEKLILNTLFLIFTLGKSLLWSLFIGRFIFIWRTKKWSLVGLNRWSFYTEILCELAWVDSTLVVLDKWSSYRAVMLSHSRRFYATCSSTDRFLWSIPVCGWWIFCCGNLILQKKEMKIIKTHFFWWKTKKKNKKVYWNIK